MMISKSESVPKVAITSSFLSVTILSILMMDETRKLLTLFGCKLI